MFTTNFWYYICKDSNPSYTTAAFMSDWDVIKSYKANDLQELGYVIYTSAGEKCDPNAEETQEPLQALGSPPS